MTAKIIEIITMEGIAIICFAFAYLIGAKGRLDLIAGYNRHTAVKVKDKNGLKRLMTRLCVLLGAGSALMPILTHYLSKYPNGLAYSIGGYSGFIIGLVCLVVLQSRDYTS